MCSVDVELSFYAVLPLTGTNELIFGHFFGHVCYWKHFVFYQIHVFWNENNESTILVFIMGLFFFVSSETGSQCQKGSGYIFSKSCEILWNFYDPLYPQFQNHFHIWRSNYIQLTNWSLYQSTTLCEKYLKVWQKSNENFSSSKASKCAKIKTNTL